jgi:hypothetical protein
MDGAVGVMNGDRTELRQTYLCEYPFFEGSFDASHSHPQLSLSSSGGSSDFVSSSLLRCFSGSLQAKKGSLVITIMRSIYTRNSFVVHVVDQVTGTKNNALFSNENAAASYAKIMYGI